MTKTDWTAEEVRKAISGFAGYCYSHHGIGSEMIDIAHAFAERIAADEGAVPAAYMWEQFYQHENEGQAKWHTALADFPDYEERDPEEVRNIQPLFTHPPAQETPCSLNEALNVIEHWGRRGNTLNGDDVDRFRALADKIAPAQEQPGWKVPDGDFPERKWFVVTGNNEAETPILVFTSRGIADEYCARNPSKRGYRVYEAASPTPPKEK